MRRFAWNTSSRLTKPETRVPAGAVGVIVIGMTALAPGWRYTGLKPWVMPLTADQRSPVDGVTEVSNARVIASNPALAVIDGAPDGPYGPISLGLSSQIPGATSPPWGAKSSVAAFPDW